MTADTVATAEIPGLVVRPYAGEADNAELVRIQNAEYEADGIRGRISVPEVDAWLRHPSEQFDGVRDLRIAELDGNAVAFEWTDWVDTTDGLREYRTRGFVDPAARRRGIGGVLFADGVRRLRAVAAGHVTERPKVLGTFTDDKSAGAPMLVTRFGLQPARYFFDMERSLIGNLPDVPP